MCSRALLIRGVLPRNVLGLDIEPTFPAVGLQMFDDRDSEIANRYFVCWLVCCLCLFVLCCVADVLIDG